ncbi:DUF3574 domain-containing protein [Marinibactrum halimedae]|uniref:DUF3574 domain-containing protein n=1 Tax=Marinibactrum halimedae TaxID=1444977 RepID=A0AA37WQX7_9GAMM|nr:DUF3574 domain-containing protein [Marinibactrum halimedae]MCD9460500.1 DUF3574 domain-containing protein [Marinibactrum halimedae]GLS27862.1 hypothetical protein GCM10007877_35810 [Marinibactrum halimedae]
MNIKLNMRKIGFTVVWVLCCSIFTPLSCYAKDIWSVKLYFGLSIPKGNGVSLKQWESFQSDVIAKNFKGFNVVDSLGFYEGEKERSKVVTMLVMSVSDIEKAKKVAANYATVFGQESVMMTVNKIDDLTFVGSSTIESSSVEK